MDNKQCHNHGLKKENTTVNSPHHLSFHLSKTSHLKPFNRTNQQVGEKGKGTDSSQRKVKGP